MKKRVTPLLKRYPPLYRLAANTYWTLSPYHLMELLIGTKAREREWSRRHLRKGNDWNNISHVGEVDEWVLSYWDSQSHGHRPLLLKKLSSYSPSSVLEIGCNCGPNLYLLAKRFPEIEIRGIDINATAIEKGKELFASEGISNVKLSFGKADGLGQFEDKSFDVVFTDAVLIYIGRDKIKQVIQEMLRIARRALVLVEWHGFDSQNKKDPNGLGVYYGGCWKRDYTALLKQFVPDEHISISKIPEDLWPDARWREVGAIIEVLCGQDKYQGAGGG